MLRQFCVLFLLLSVVHTASPFDAVPEWAIRGGSEETQSTVQNDPEIDRSPIWAMVFGRYLYHLGREMFWPELDERARFQIGVVRWSALAEDLASQLEGRAIAGLPVDITPLTAAELRDHRGDFTMLFLGDTNAKSGKEEIEESLKRWNKKQDKKALIITDGAQLPACDLVFQRRGEGQDIGLCLIQQLENLENKGMVLPAPFLQRLCP